MAIFKKVINRKNFEEITISFLNQTLAFDCTFRGFLCDFFVRNNSIFLNKNNLKKHTYNLIENFNDVGEFCFLKLKKKFKLIKSMEVFITVVLRRLEHTL